MRKPYHHYSLYSTAILKLTLRKMAKDKDNMDQLKFNDILRELRYRLTEIQFDKLTKTL